MIIIKAFERDLSQQKKKWNELYFKLQRHPSLRREISFTDNLEFWEIDYCPSSAAFCECTQALQSSGYCCSTLIRYETSWIHQLDSSQQDNLNSFQLPRCMYKMHKQVTMNILIIFHLLLKVFVCLRAENLMSLWGLTSQTGSICQCRWMLTSFQAAAFNPFQQSWGKHTQGKEQTFLIGKQWHWPWLW